MSASVNKCIILGNLGADPELRYTQNQTPVASINIATTEYSTDASGQRQEKTEWHKVVLWAKMAENAAKYLSRGRSVYVEGRLQTRMWEKDGVKHYTTEIVAQNIQFLGGNPNQTQGQEQPRQQPRQAPAGNGGQPKPQQQQQQGYNPPAASTGFPDLPGLDEVPF